MIPFLKNREEVMASGEEEPTIGRKPDQDEFNMLDAVVEDILDAVTRKDKGLLKMALEGLCDYIREKDEDQDEQLEM